MANSLTNLTSGSDQDGNSTAVTASITPTANNLVLLSVMSRTGISTDPVQPTATGNGLTWVVVNSVVYDTTGASRKRITLFRAMGASPSAGAVSIDFGGQNQTHVIFVVDQAAGTDTSGTNGSGAVVQSAVNSEPGGDGGDLTITLAAFGNANNSTYGVFTGDDIPGAPSPEAGYTALFSSASIASQTYLSEWIVSNDTTPTATFNSNPTQSTGGIAIEIAMAGGTPTWGQLLAMRNNRLVNVI